MKQKVGVVHDAILVNVHHLGTLKFEAHFKSSGPAGLGRTLEALEEVHSPAEGFGRPVDLGRRKC